MEKKMQEDFLKPNAYSDVYELSRLRATVEGRVRLSDMKRLTDLILPSEQSIAFTIEGIVGDKGWPGAVMTVKGEVPLECSRCNKSMTFELEREVTFRFVRNEEEADSLPIEEDDDTEVIVGSNKLNLMDWIEEEVILSLPIVPMHEEQCVEPVHIHLDDEHEVPRENPFAKLKELSKLRKND